MGKRNSRATSGTTSSSGKGKGKGVFSASSASTSSLRPKANAGAAEHYAFRRSKDHSGIDVDANPYDAYELATEKKEHRRAGVTTDLSRDEEAPGVGANSKRRPHGGEGGDGEDDDEMEEDGDAVRERLKKLVNSHELMTLESGSEDEELDSDSAFEDDDAGRGWGAAFVQKGKKKTKKAVKVAAEDDDDEDLDIDLSEGDDDGDAPRSRPARTVQEGGYDSDEVDFDSDEAGDEGFVDLSTLLGAGQGFGPPSDDDEDDEEEGESASGEEEDDMDMDDDDEESGSDEDDEEAADRLNSLIAGLPSKRKSAPGESDDEDVGASRAKRRVLKDRNEEGRKEGSFGAPLNANGKLSIQTLLAPLPAAQSSALLNSTKALAAPNTGAALPAPLAGRAQDRLEREAAYEATKGEVTKWGASMKRIKEAEHLSFPLQAQKAEKPSAAALVAKFQPTGDFESAVANLINSAKMGDDAEIAKREEMAMSNLTIEEVAARRAELAHMRELMFRAETKAKRVAKIKSKTYRKIQRKEADRNADKLAEAGFGEDEEEVRIKKDRERAIERATLKHKNTGKWAKAMLNKADDLDVDQRRELNEQLREGDRLQARIQGRGSGSEGESDSDDDGGQDLATLRGRAFAEIDGMDGQPDEEIKTKSGLFQMKFMTDARARANAQVGKDADDFRREMDHLEASDEEDADESLARESFTKVGGNAGRQVYGQGIGALPKHVQPPASDAASTATLQSSHPSDLSPPATHSKPFYTISSNPTAVEDTTSNPWLNATGSSSKISRKKNQVSGKEASMAEKSAKNFKKSLSKVDEAREREQDDAQVDIDPSAVSMAAPSKTVDKGKGRAQRRQADEDDDEESETDDHERRGPIALRQRDLVAQAFAGDNVLEDFAEEKRREEDRDKPQEVDTTLPGWGSWGGRGTKKAKPNKKNIKHIPGVDVSKRKDFQKSHVIISEKKDKKATKHMTKDLPYPYTSAAQYEASLRGAVGAEWSTRATVQKATMPRVTKKMGTIIHPLQKQW